MLEGATLTMQNCMLRVRQFLAREEKRLEVSMCSGHSYYLLLYGAKKYRPAEAGEPAPAMHITHWTRRAAGRPLVTCRVTKLLSPQAAAAEWPGRADAGIYKRSADGETLVKSRHLRWGDRERTTRLQAPVVLSDAYRVVPLTYMGAKTAATDKLWEEITSLNQGHLPIIYRAGEKGWPLALRALRDSWGWKPKAWPTGVGGGGVETLFAEAICENVIVLDLSRLRMYEETRAGSLQYFCML